jgi:hypothetical protein
MSVVSMTMNPSEILWLTGLLRSVSGFTVFNKTNVCLISSV